MTQAEQSTPPRLFTLRIWLEQANGSSPEWRGKIQDVHTGERHYFRDWPNLVSHLRTMVPEEPNLDIEH